MTRRTMASPRPTTGQRSSRQDAVVKRLVGGVSGLLKKNKVKVIQGTAKLGNGKTVTVAPDGASQSVTTTS